MLEHTFQLLKDSSVASIARTLPRAVRHISSSLDFQTAKLILEYGPGDGALTEYILDRMRPDCRLVAIETNDYFVSVLKTRIADRRFCLVHESAENILEIAKRLKITNSDYVVSGIPFSLFDFRLKKEIIRDTAEVIKPEGKFILYQSLTAMHAMKPLRRALRSYFDLISYRTVLLNLPPLYVIEGMKR